MRPDGDNSVQQGDRIHHVSCTMHSRDLGTDDYNQVCELASRLAKYARRLGFDVMQEGVDYAD